MKGNFVICTTQQIPMILVMKKRGMRGRSKKRNAYRILVSKAEGMDHLKDLGIDRRIILK